jgi:hypothetical protein
LDVVFDPLGRLTVRDLDWRIFETVRRDTRESTSDPTVKAHFDRTNYICNNSGAVGRVLNRELEIDLERNISPLSSFDVDVADLLVLQRGNIV